MIFSRLSVMLACMAPARLLALILGLNAVSSVLADGNVAVESRRIDAQRGPAIWTESAGLTLREAMYLVLKFNPELAASAGEIGALEGATLQAGLLRNPQLGLDVEDIGATQGRGLQRYTTLRIGQSIELGGKRQARVTAAALAQDVARQAYEAKRLELLARVADAFTDVLAAQERTRLAADSVALAQEVVTAVARRVQAGKAPPIEETKAKLALSTARIEQEQARRELAAGRKRVTLLWGNPSPRFDRALGDLASVSSLPSFEVLAERVRLNPAAARDRKSVEQRTAVLALERTRRVPDITLIAGVRSYSQSGENTPQVGISIALPVFDRNQGNLLEAQRRVSKAEDERAATDFRLQSELAQTYEALLAAINEIGVLRDEVLPGASSAFSVANRGYELGKFGFLDVLDAQRTLFQNRSLYLRALTNYRKLVNEIERLTAAPIDDRSDWPVRTSGDTQ